MKTFYSLFMMAVVAVCAAFTSCNSVDDDELETKPYEFVEAAHFSDAAHYDIDALGSFLELTENGMAICCIVNETRAAGDKTVTTGSWKKNSDGDIVLNGSQLKGTLKKGDKDVNFNVNGLQVTATRAEKAQDSSTDAKKYCNTWKIGRTICDGSKVTISDPAYAQYFGEYGYPVQITFTSLNTFYCEMSKCSVTGSWKWNGKKMDVSADPFLSSFEWVTDDEVALKFAVKWEGQVHDFKVYLTSVAN